MKKKPFILGILIGSILTPSLIIYGANTLYNAVEVKYDNTSSGTTKIEVQGALDELYQMSKTHCPDGYNCEKKKNGAELLLSKANKDTITDYNAGNKGEMYAFYHEATLQTPETMDYRYIGNVPNNYITFNNETWRIIGVFEGKIKLIKDISIGNMYWDYKKTGVGSANMNGSNDWSDSQLMYLLNTKDFPLKSGYTNDGTYIRDTNGKIVYQLGCLPANTDGNSYSCTQNTWSLSDLALSQVDTVIYYLGGNVPNSGQSATTHYNSERGNKVTTGRPIKWEGKVGLMYPSDYAYTYAYGVDNKCYTDTYNCSSGNKAAGWLFNSAYQRTMAPGSSRADFVLLVGGNGAVGNNNTHGNDGVRPVVYLRPDIELSGSGTTSNPYLIKN